MFKIENVKVLSDYRLWLRFSDGTSGTINLSPIAGQGVFSVWEDPEVFADVHIGTFGELVWPNDVELCPDALYLQITDQEPEDVFPKLTTVRQHA